jgi:hypothetical protein
MTSLRPAGLGLMLSIWQPHALTKILKRLQLLGMDRWG